MDESLTAAIHDAMPLAALLGIAGVEAGPDAVALRGAWAPEHCTAAGVLHGGYLMALADMSAAMLAHLNLPDGARTATSRRRRTSSPRSAAARSSREPSSSTKVGPRWCSRST